MAAPLPPPAEVLKELRALESAHLRGESEACRARFQPQITANPTDVMARVYFAWCSMPSDEAWNELKKVAFSYPEVPWPHYGMGRIYIKWKIRDQAENEFRIALGGGNKKFYPGQVGLADVLRAAGKHAEAEAKYREVLATDDDAEARAGLGLALLAQGKSADAQAELSRAFELWPDQPEVLNALATLARGADDPRSALRYARQLARIWPRDKAVRRVVADLHFELGEKELASKEYEALLKLGEKDAFVLKRLSELYRDLGNKGGLERTLTMLASGDSDTDSLVKLAELAEGRGALAEADKRLTQALEREPKKLELLLRMARVKAKRELYLEALDLYRAAQVAGARADEVSESLEIARKFRLPAQPISGKNVQQIYDRVNGGLYALYTERLKDNAALGGALKLRVKVDAQGKVQNVEWVEDTVRDPYISGHVYFALKDAVYPKQKREPLFEFNLQPPLQGSR